jgi:hypothetical protein
MFSHSWSDQASQVSKEHCLSSNKLHASKCFLSGKRLCSQLSVCTWLYFSPQLEHCFLNGPVMCVYWLLYDHVQVCTFYQCGLCSYGSRCRYENVKLPPPVSNNPLPPPPRPSVVALNSCPDTSRAEESSSTHTQSAWQLTEGKANLGPRFLIKKMMKRLKRQHPATQVSSQSVRLQLLAYALGVITARRFMVTCAQLVGSIVCIHFVHQNLITTGSSVNQKKQEPRNWMQCLSGAGAFKANSCWAEIWINVGLWSSILCWLYTGLAEWFSCTRDGHWYCCAGLPSLSSSFTFYSPKCCLVLKFWRKGG